MPETPSNIKRWWMIVRPDQRGLHGHTYEDEAIARQVAAAGLGEDVIAVVPAVQLEGAVETTLREVVDEARDNPSGREFTDEMLLFRIGRVVLDRLGKENS